VAENGVSVPPSINAPETDVSAALTELNAVPADVPSVASDPCASFTAGAPSSLVEAGRGALPTTSTAVIEQTTPTREVSSAEHRYALAPTDSYAGSNASVGCRSDV